MKRIHFPQAWNDPVVQPKRWQRDGRFGTLCRSGLIMTAARELARY